MLGPSDHLRCGSNEETSAQPDCVCQKNGFRGRLSHSLVHLIVSYSGTVESRRKPNAEYSLVIFLLKPEQPDVNPSEVLGLEGIQSDCFQHEFVLGVHCARVFWHQVLGRHSGIFRVGHNALDSRQQAERPGCVALHLDNFCSVFQRSSGSNFVETGSENGIVKVRYNWVPDTPEVTHPFPVFSRGAPLRVGFWEAAQVEVLGD